MLRIRNLSKVFYKGTANENAVFDNLSLDVKKGDFITIIGSNGAGKSTLLNLISGAYKADSGFITLDGADISNLPEYKRTRFIGRVFQNPSTGTSPSMTILENMSMAYNKGKRFGLSPGISKKDIQLFKDMLSELSLGLEDRINMKVGLLSGGQRQALSLIMASMSNPKLLLLDEHTAALDPRASEKVIGLTKKLISEKGMTSLMVTHNLNQAISIGSRLLMFHGGKVVLDMEGEDKKQLTREKLISCFESMHCEDGLSDRTLFSN